jgi:hypothetical protein
VKIYASPVKELEEIGKNYEKTRVGGAIAAGRSVGSVSLPDLTFRSTGRR